MEERRPCSYDELLKDNERLREENTQLKQRMKPACKCVGNKIVIAEMPIRTIDKGSVTTEFVAAVLVNKYCDHLPVYRQVRRMFKNMKLDIVVALVAHAESSVCRWRDAVGDQLDDFVKLMKSEIKQSYCVNTDGSGRPLHPG